MVVEFVDDFVAGTVLENIVKRIAILYCICYLIINIGSRNLIIETMRLRIYVVYLAAAKYRGLS